MIEKKAAKNYSVTNSICIAFLLVLGFLFSYRGIYSGDIGYHIKAGEWIIEHLKFPANDMFTYTVSGHEYIDMYWLYQVILALINKLSGEFGLVTLNALFMVASFSLMIVRIKRFRTLRETSLWQCIFLLALIATSALFETRPHSFSWLYLSLLLLILEDYYHGRDNKLFFLPMIMLFWTNTHTLFILGWIVIACYWVGMIQREKSLHIPFTVYALVSLGISLVNPYFLNGVLLPFYQFQFLQVQSSFKSMIAEYKSSLDFGSYIINGRFVLFQPLFAFHLLFFISALAFLRQIKHERLHEILIFCLFSYIALSGFKNIGYFVFATVPMTIQRLQKNTFTKHTAKMKGTLQQFARRFITSIYSFRMQLGINAAVMIISLILGLLICNNAYYIYYRADYRFGYRYDNQTLPVGAAKFLQDNKLEGRLLNHFNFGGFFIYTLPQKVCIDGRNEVFGEDFFSEYFNLWSDVNKEPILERFRPDIIVFPHQYEFSWIDYFRKDTLWRLVYFDELAAVYLKRGYAENIPSVNYLFQLNSYPVIAQSQIDSLLRKEDPNECSVFSFKKQYFPRKEIGLLGFCLYHQWYQPAIQFGLNGLEKSSMVCPELYYNLAMTFFATKELDRATYCYKRAQ